MENVYFITNDLFQNKDIEEIKYPQASLSSELQLLTKDLSKAYKAKQ